MRLQVIKHSRIWLIISAVLVLASILATAVFGLNFGIDFTGGSLSEFTVEQEVDVTAVREFYSERGFDAVVQEGSDGVFIVRTAEMNPEQHQGVLTGLEERFGTVEELRFEAVGPVIGQELKRKSVLAVAVLLALIVVYVAWSFRQVSEPVASWKYGVLTIVAALHDVIIPIGVFAVLGEFLGYQVDTAFIAAILTILGYSINDTIVIFDRARENLAVRKHAEEDFSEIVDASVEQSLTRSINTSFTTLLVLLAIFFFGGETTRSFILALIVGIIAGAYSSIFLASPLLVLWEKFTRK